MSKPADKAQSPDTAGTAPQTAETIGAPQTQGTAPEKPAAVAAVPESEDEEAPDATFVYTPSIDSRDHIGPEPQSEEQVKKQQQKDFELALPVFDLTLAQQNDIQVAFNSFDLNGTGSMEASELPVALRALGFHLKPKEMKALLGRLDPNATGKLCYSDFLLMIQIKLGERDDKKDLRKAFKMFDLDRTGKISYENIRTVAFLLGADLNDEEAQEMIAEADVDLDGEVDFDEFVRIITKINIYY